MNQDEARYLELQAERDFLAKALDQAIKFAGLGVSINVGDGKVNNVTVFGSLSHGFPMHDMDELAAILMERHITREQDRLKYQRTQLSAIRAKVAEIRAKDAKV